MSKLIVTYGEMNANHLPVNIIGYPNEVHPDWVSPYKDPSALADLFVNASEKSMFSKAEKVVIETFTLRLEEGVFFPEYVFKIHFKNHIEEGHVTGEYEVRKILKDIPSAYVIKDSVQTEGVSALTPPYNILRFILRVLPVKVVEIPTSFTEQFKTSYVGDGSVGDGPESISDNDVDPNQEEPHLNNKTIGRLESFVSEEFEGSRFIGLNETGGAKFTFMLDDATAAASYKELHQRLLGLLAMRDIPWDVEEEPICSHLDPDDGCSKIGALVTFTYTPE